MLVSKHLQKASSRSDAPLDLGAIAVYGCGMEVVLDLIITINCSKSPAGDAEFK